MYFGHDGMQLKRHSPNLCSKIVVCTRLYFLHKIHSSFAIFHSFYIFKVVFICGQENDPLPDP